MRMPGEAVAAQERERGGGALGSGLPHRTMPPPALPPLSHPLPPSPSPPLRRAAALWKATAATLSNATAPQGNATANSTTQAIALLATAKSTTLATTAAPAATATVNSRTDAVGLIAKTDITTRATAPVNAVVRTGLWVLFWRVCAGRGAMHGDG